MPVESSDNEKELFIRIAEGDEEAFIKIFHSYNAKLFPSILQLTKSRSEAEEVMQNLFLKLWTNRSSLYQIDNPGGWLYRVASNLALTELRTKAASKKHSKVLEGHQSESDDSLLQQLDAAELRNLIAEAAEKLPKKQQQVFYYSRTKGMNRQEIAQILGISESTVKNQLGAALKFIQAYISKSHGLYLPFFLFLPY